MKKIVFFSLFVMSSLLVSAKTYTILGKGSNGETPAKGSISFNKDDTFSVVKVFVSDLVQKTFTLCNVHIIDDFTLKYEVYNDKSRSVIVRQDSSNPNVYYFEVPNFYEGQSGTILYKTTSDNAEYSSTSPIEKATAMGSLFGSSSTPANQSNPISMSNAQGGSSWTLSGRTVISMPQPSYDFNQEGTVVVRVQVNAAGKVVDAKVDTGTTINDPHTIQLAIEAAYKATFSRSDASSQIGTITYRFKIK